jgi:hypothetical protein
VRLQAFQSFLRGSDRSDLNPARLEREVALLVIDREGGRETVDKEARSLKREDVSKVLRQRRDISHREADSIADLIDSARTRMLSRTEIREHRRQESTDQALSRLRDRLYSLARPERDYSGFRKDLERLLQDQAASGGTSESELREWDRNALTALFFSKQGISQSDADKMAESAEAAIQQARETARKIEAEIARRREEVRLAVEASDAGARILAISSSRWLTGIALACAAAAGLGGWLGSRP